MYRRCVEPHQKFAGGNLNELRINAIEARGRGGEFLVP
jgi:hypothetical protein